MLNRAKDSSVSMPLVPRSMTRERPPVLRLQVEAQRERVDMGEGRNADFAQRVILHLGENAVAQLRESLHHDARKHIGDDEAEGDGDRGAASANETGPSRGPECRDWRPSPESRTPGRRARRQPAAAGPAAPSATDRAKAYREAGAKVRRHRIPEVDEPLKSFRMGRRGVSGMVIISSEHGRQTFNLQARNRARQP